MLKRFVSYGLVPGLVVIMSGCAVDTSEDVGAAPQASVAQPDLVVTSYTQSCESRVQGQSYIRRTVVITNQGLATSTYMPYAFRAIMIACSDPNRCYGGVWAPSVGVIPAGESRTFTTTTAGTTWTCAQWAALSGSWRINVDHKPNNGYPYNEDPIGNVVESDETNNNLVTPNTF